MQNAKVIPWLSPDMVIAAQISAAQDGITVHDLLRVALERELRRREKRRKALRLNRASEPALLQPNLS